MLEKLKNFKETILEKLRRKNVEEVTEPPGEVTESPEAEVTELPEEPEINENKPAYARGFGEVEEESQSNWLSGDKEHPAFHVFLYLVNFASLGFIIYGVIRVYFELIDKFFPSKEAEVALAIFDQEALQLALVYLLVGLPIYYTVSILINEKLIKGEINPQSKIRKLFIYLALAIFTIAMMGSLAGLFFNFLNGELARKVYLKTFILLAVLIFFFVRHFWDVRRKEFGRKVFYSLASASLLITFSGLILGLIVIDSPTVIRQKRADNQKIEKMKDLTFMIEDFYEENKKVPRIRKNEITPTEGLEYKEIDKKNYKLCAEFNHSNQNEPMEEYKDEMWRHPKGIHCFEMNVTRVR